MEKKDKRPGVVNRNGQQRPKDMMAVRETRHRRRDNTTWEWEECDVETGRCVGDRKKVLWMARGKETTKQNDKRGRKHRLDFPAVVRLDRKHKTLFPDLRNSEINDRNGKCRPGEKKVKYRKEPYGSTVYPVQQEQKSQNPNSQGSHSRWCLLHTPRILAVSLCEPGPAHPLPQFSLFSLLFK